MHSPFPGFVLVLVVVQRLEGSRFGAGFVALATSYYHEPGRDLRQQAAPGNDPAACSSTTWILTNRKPRVDASRWVIRGSRLLQHFWTDRALERISRRRLVRAKAAPLQELGTNMPRQLADRFEDEDENEAT